MLFSEYKLIRMTELMREQWGNVRLPDLMEVLLVARPRRVLEIGSYRGVSTEFWALHCERVMSVDPSPDLAVRRDLHARVGHYPHVTLIEGLSPVDIIDSEFDLVYLDGDHSYEKVCEEITHYRKYKPTWIGGHDYTDTPASGDGVKRAVYTFFGEPDHHFSDGSWLVKLGERQWVN